MTQLQNTMDKLISSEAQMSLENILNMEGKDDNAPNNCEESLVAAVLRDIGVQKSDDEEATNSSIHVDVQPLSRVELLRNLSVVRRGEIDNNVLSAEGCGFISSFQRKLHTKKLKSHRQRTVNEQISISSKISR